MRNALFLRMALIAPFTMSFVPPSFSMESWVEQLDLLKRSQKLETEIFAQKIQISQEKFQKSPLSKQEINDIIKDHEKGSKNWSQVSIKQENVKEFNEFLNKLKELKP